MTESFNSDAEVAVISIILNNPELAEAVNLKPYMFSSPLSPNAVIFECIYELQLQGAVPESFLVTTKLESSGKLDKAGGKEYLDYLLKSEYSKDNLQEFASQVIAGYKARSLISISAESTAKIKSGTDVDVVLSDLERTLISLRENASADSAVDVSVVTRETWEFIEERIKNPGLTGVTTGLSDLDLLTGGYNPGKLWVVAGRPGMGKTADMCNSVLDAAVALKDTGEHILVFSLEMASREIVLRMLAIHTGIEVQDILFGTLKQKQLDEIREALKYFNTLPIILDDVPSTDEKRFLSVARRHNKTKKLRLIYVDYLQLGTERDEKQTQAIGRFTRAGKLLAKEIQCTCIFYSQLNRSVESRDDKRPQLSDLKQSGSIEDDADVVKFLYRDEYYHKDTKQVGIMEQDLGKHRDGKVGMFAVKFEGETMRITDN